MKKLAPGVLALAALAAGAAAGDGAPGVAARETPAARPAPPVGAMPPLRPAEIDNSLAIGGEDIDARKVRSRMTVAVRVNGRGPYRFVVDSGADSSVVGRGLAQALRLPPAAPAILNTMTETRQIERAQVEELTVGPTTVNGLVVPVLEERHLGGEGMLGLDALVEQRLMLDFEKRTISVDDAAAPPPRLDNEIVVTARLQRGQLILTQASAQKLRISAVIDTGSEVTIGNRALRDKLVKRRGAKLETVEITGVTGAKATLEYTTVSELKLGPVILRNVPMAFADVPPFAVFGIADQPALLLGTDLMENFRKVSLDFRARKVRFQLRKCTDAAVRIGSSPRQLSRLGTDRSTPAACS
ncbi:MAG: retroviral-like aspartic protease family protein [Cypionkella sp.]